MTVAGDLYCTVCYLIPRGERCRLCGRTNAPERDGAMPLALWLKRRGLSQPVVPEGWQDRLGGSGDPERGGGVAA